MLKTDRHTLFSQWVLCNFLGWLLGVFLGLGLGQFVVIPLIERSFGYVFVLEHKSVIGALILWFPFGLCLASMQLLAVRKWGIRSLYWLLTTALGWAVLAAAFSFVDDNSYRLGRASYILLLVVILFGGAVIGTAQSVEIRKVISKPSLWIIANSLGLFALGLVTIAILVSVFSVKSYILNFLYANDLNGLVRARGLLLNVAITILLPFLSTFTISRLTGWVIMKYPRLHSSEGNNSDQYRMVHGQNAG